MSERKPTKKRAATQVKRPAGPPAAARRRRHAPPAPRMLVHAPPEKCFWVNHGPVLKNLQELRDALTHNISDGQFAYHVGPGRNDFAGWVEAVLDDAACARALRRAKTRRGALRAVRVSLAIYA